MKGKPILYNTEMVKATLDGLKTQTRRVITPQPKSFGRSWYWTEEDVTVRESLVEIFDVTPHVIWAEEYLPSSLSQFCPFGQPGDRLWVKESIKITGHNLVTYAADGLTRIIDHPRCDEIWRGINSKTTRRNGIFMPRWAARIQLEITRVRVERVQDITERDAMQEGVWDGYTHTHDPNNPEPMREYFKSLWDSINAKRGFGWDVNPWVWVIEFEVIDTKGERS